MNDDVRTPAPRSWQASLDRADADIAAGRVHDFEEMMAELEREDAQDEDTPRPGSAATSS